MNYKTGQGLIYIKKKSIAKCSLQFNCIHEIIQIFKHYQYSLFLYQKHTHKTHKEIYSKEWHNIGIFILNLIHVFQIPLPLYQEWIFDGRIKKRLQLVHPLKGLSVCNYWCFQQPHNGKTNTVNDKILFCLSTITGASEHPVPLKVEVKVLVGDTGSHLVKGSLKVFIQYRAHL